MNGIGMTRNDLTNWIVYWLKCDAAQSAAVHRCLSTMSITELIALESRGFHGESKSILDELTATNAGLASV